MLEKSDTSISEVLKKFNEFDLEVCLLVPTSTGLKKSILDATATVRDYLVDTGFHDYFRQEQGQENKIVRRAFYINPDGIKETTVSLYRPITKKGDPRIWFGKMRKYANPLNLLALIVHNEDIYVVNCSVTENLLSLSNENSPLGKIAAFYKCQIDPIVLELLDLIRDISKKGFIKTLRGGDTGIGMTLESYLGISANSSKDPDYKGIEIKAKRLRGSRQNRVTLFSQVPNWKISPIESAWNLLSMYGYLRNNKLRLNHQIVANKPNSIGFMLRLDSQRDWLMQNHIDKKLSTETHVTTWEMEVLRSRLSEKHPQTFWVGAKCKGSGFNELFHFVQVEHTKSPNIRNFNALLEGGLISVDYLMSQKQIGKETVRDHGYLFKIKPSDFNALFPPSEIHVFE